MVVVDLLVVWYALFSGCVGGPLSPPSELSAIIGEIVLEISSSPGIHIYSPRVNSTPGTVHLGIIYPWHSAAEGVTIGKCFLMMEVLRLNLRQNSSSPSN